MLEVYRGYDSPVVELIGAPFDGCGRREGSRLGPAALRLAGVVPTLTSLGLQVTDRGDLPIGTLVNRPGLRNFSTALPIYRGLKNLIAQAVGEGSVPLMFGGDHSLAIGSIAGAIEATQGDLAVLWIDAHADYNTPGSSPSGNLHGMPLGALVRADDPRDCVEARDWATLLEDVVPNPGLMPSRIAWIGLRDVDSAEAARIKQSTGAYVATMSDIDRHGMNRSLEDLGNWLKRQGARNLWVSFDVDVLDPILAPGTGTAVRGGFTYREMHLLGEVLHEWLAEADCPYRLCGVDLVETNPLYDTSNETARTAVEWVGSLFGKTILGRG